MSRCIERCLSLLIVLSGCGCVHADDLGRLFTSAADRARIDNQRLGREVATQESPGVVLDQTAVNGTIVGSSGKRLVWLNGAPVTPGSAADKVKLLHDGRVRLSWREGDQPRELKPGQGLDQTSGEVYELYTRAPAPVPEPAVVPVVAAKVAAAPAATTAPVEAEETVAAPAGGKKGKSNKTDAKGKAK